MISLVRPASDKYAWSGPGTETSLTPLHYGMTPGPWIWSVSVLQANKLSLQGWNH